MILRRQGSFALLRCFFITSLRDILVICCIVLQYLKTSFPREPQCDPGLLDHAVLAIGYGSVEGKGDYWLVKNSWGAEWGEGGFVRIAREEDNMCGVASQAAYPLPAQDL